MAVPAEQRERVVETGSPEETERLAAQYSEGLAPGVVVLVSGELGSGKTTWVRGAARALGVADPVVSPTFTVGSRYRGRVTVTHLDLYRITDLSEEDPALLADYLGPDVVAFVEWPERARAEGLGPVALRVRLEHLGGARRRVAIR